MKSLLFNGTVLYPRTQFTLDVAFRRISNITLNGLLYKSHNNNIDGLFAKGYCDAKVVGNRNDCGSVTSTIVVAKAIVGNSTKILFPKLLVSSCSNNICHTNMPRHHIQIRGYSTPNENQQEGNINLSKNDYNTKNDNEKHSVKSEMKNIDKSEVNAAHDSGNFTSKGKHTTNTCSDTFGMAIVNISGVISDISRGYLETYDVLQFTVTTFVLSASDDSSYVPHVTDKNTPFSHPMKEKGSSNYNGDITNTSSSSSNKASDMEHRISALKPLREGSSTTIHDKNTILSHEANPNLTLKGHNVHNMHKVKEHYIVRCFGDHLTISALRSSIADGKMVSVTGRFKLNEQSIGISRRNVSTPSSLPTKAYFPYIRVDFPMSSKKETTVVTGDDKDATSTQHHFINRSDQLKTTSSSHFLLSATHRSSIFPHVPFGSVTVIME